MSGRVVSSLRVPGKHGPCVSCVWPHLGPSCTSHSWSLWGSHGCSSPALPNSTTWFKPVSSGGPGPSPSHLHFLPSRMLSSVVPGPGGHSRPRALSAAPQGSLAAGLPQPPGWQRLSQVSPAPHSTETAAAAAAATTPTPPSQPAAAAALSSSQGPEGVTCNRRCLHRTSQRPPACHLITHSSISHGQQRPSPALCSRCSPGAQRAHRGAASACAPSLWLLHLLWRRCSAQAFLLGLCPHLPRFCSLASGALGLSSLYTHCDPCQERVYPNPLVSSATAGDPDFWARPVPLPCPSAGALPLLSLFLALSPWLTRPERPR